MTPKQLNLEMMMRNLPYGPDTTKAYKVRNILQHDDDDKGTGASQSSYLIVPPSEVIHQPAADAAAAVERRPIPIGGLTMHNLKDYSEDRLDAERRALGIAVDASTSEFTKML